MIKEKDLKIIMITGLHYSGVSEVAKIFKSSNYPTIDLKDTNISDIHDECQNLIASGQKTIILAGQLEWQDYKYLAHAFHGSLTVLSVFSPKSLRTRRFLNDLNKTTDSLEQLDYQDLEGKTYCLTIAIAKKAINNDKDLPSLKAEVIEIAKEFNLKIV